MEPVREGSHPRAAREPLTGTPVLPPGSRRILLRESGASVEPAPPATAAPNAVRTHRYTPLTWLPKSLYVQFMRLANIYFVIVAVVACTPLWGRKAAAKVMTVTTLLLVQALKDLYEDSKRRNDDHAENARPVRVFDPEHGCFREVQWQACRVGDVVAVDKGQQLPADVLVAASASSGTVFISTKSLDGETNLKQRAAPALLQSVSRTATGAIEAAAELVQGLEVQLEPPHASLLKIECSVAVGGEVSGVSIENFVLRGCILENTAWLVGIVCYVGNDTKVRLNSSEVPSKRSELEQFLNYCVVIIVLLIFATSLLFASLEKLLGTNRLTFVKAFATYFVILYVVLPMSLYVMFEAMKLAIGQQIERDPHMVDDETGKPARARNTSVLEELGEVEYLFSDKTGTLTANEMHFAFCFIGDETIGPFLPDALGAPGPGVDITSQLLSSPDGDRAAAFFEALALCHTVRTDEDGAYQGESPDDVALVQAARSVGVALRSRSAAGLELESVREGHVRREVACVLPFSSDRKRMSVVCRTSAGGALVITKGADSVMEERLAAGLPDGARRALYDFARKGLRTLVVASRRMDAATYALWKARWDEASSAVGGQRSIQLEAVAAEAEWEMEFLGVSALEDALQESVPETIAALRAAGIRIWVLTGDKVETAVEIARSCALFEDGMPLVYVTGAASSDEAYEMLRPHSTISPRRTRGTSFGSFVSQNMPLAAPSRGIVLDGISAQHALTNTRGRQALFQLAERCSSCVCCRLSPMQKRELVELVREYSNRAVTLAVGDGANDVPMIQGAHVGVGVRGKEGSAAVQASDMAISQFSFLGDLVLYHGRKAYARLATFLCFFLYKSVVIGCSYMLYAYHVEFSGKLAFPEWLDAMYSPLTSLGIAILLLFDNDSSSRGGEVALSPELYSSGPNRACLNAKVYMKWMFYALLHGTLAWEVPFQTLLGDLPEVVLNQGFKFWQVSFTAFTNIIIVIHVKILIMVEKPIRPLGFVAIVMEVLAYFAVALVMGSPLCRSLAPRMEGIPVSVLTSGCHVLLMTVTPMASLFFDIVALSGASLVEGARR